MAMDLVEALVALHDVGNIFEHLESALKRSRLYQSKFLSPRKVWYKSIESNEAKLSIMDIAIALHKAEESTLSGSKQLNFQVKASAGHNSTKVSPSNFLLPSVPTNGPSFASHTTQPKRTLSPRIVPFVGTGHLKASSSSNLPFRRSLSNEVTLPDKSLQDVVAGMLAEDRHQCLDVALRLLHLTEFLLLIEFTEVIIPTIYCTLTY